MLRERHIQGVDERGGVAGRPRIARQHRHRDSDERTIAPVQRQGILD
jgi:hypothetical protein